MTKHSKFSVNAVIRVPGITLSRTTLEAAVGPMDRFEPSRADGTSYAQISAPEDCTWSDVIALVERVGPTLLRHVERGEIGRPSLDVALYIKGDRVSASLLVPNEVIVSVGRFGLDLEASAYIATD